MRDRDTDAGLDKDIGDIDRHLENEVRRVLSEGTVPGVYEDMTDDMDDGEQTQTDAPAFGMAADATGNGSGIAKANADAVGNGSGIAKAGAGAARRDSNGVGSDAPRVAGRLQAAPRHAGVRLASNIEEMIKSAHAVKAQDVKAEGAKTEDVKAEPGDVGASDKTGEDGKTPEADLPNGSDGSGKAAVSRRLVAPSEAGKSDKSNKLVETDKTGEPDKNNGNDKTSESDKMGEENKPLESNPSNSSDGADGSGKAESSDAPGAPSKSDKSEEKTDNPVDTEEPGELGETDRVFKSDNKDESNVSDKTDKIDKKDTQKTENETHREDKKSEQTEQSEKPEQSEKSGSADSSAKSGKAIDIGKNATVKTPGVGASVERREIGRSRAEGSQDKEDKEDRENSYETEPDPEVRKRRRRIMGIVALMLLAVSAAYYIFMVVRYKDTYIPGTYINGISAQGKTPQEIKEIIRTQTHDYSLRVVSREREDELLSAQQVGLEYVTGDVPETILQYQNRFRWIEGFFTQRDYKVSTMTRLDEKKFIEAASALACFDDETAIEPEDAYVSDYIKTRGYEVIPEVEGNVIIDQDQAMQMIRDAMLTMDDSVDLTSAPEIYAQPKRRSNDSRLVARVTKLNKYMTITIKYLYSDLEINGDLIDEWLTVEDDGTLTFDDEQIVQFVADEVAGEFDTLYLPKELDTSWGPTVTITGGSYGWQVNQPDEVEQIKADITAAQSVERDPVYARTAAAHGDHDYGDTYVEINLTAQHLYYYKNGEQILDSDFVSGLASNSKRVTPVGAYSLTYKQTDRILRGQRRADGTYEYESHVNYWMPFNGGIGMHDASWRSSYGGTIYKTNGSHGCINMPYAAAKKLYNEIEAGCPVLCYKLEGSSGASTYVDPDKPVETGTTKPQETTTKPTTATKPAATAAPTVPPTAAPVVTLPPETQPVTAAPVEGISGGPGVTGTVAPQTQESVKEGISGGPGA